MDKFSKFNFVTYFVIILGLSVYFSFFVGTHIDYLDDKAMHKKGYGPMGTWYAFIIGLSFQFLCEIILLVFFINWEHCAFKAHQEMIEENKL